MKGLNPGVIFSQASLPKSLKIFLQRLFEIDQKRFTITYHDEITCEHMNKLRRITSILNNKIINNQKHNYIFKVIR